MGKRVGIIVGLMVGAIVGLTVGLTVGPAVVGLAVGSDVVGDAVGEQVTPQHVEAHETNMGSPKPGSGAQQPPEVKINSHTSYGCWSGSPTALHAGLAVGMAAAVAAVSVAPPPRTQHSQASTDTVVSGGT